LQLGIEPARRLELEGAGAGPGDRRASDVMACQHVTGPAGPVDRLGDRLTPVVPAAQMLGQAPESATSGHGLFGRLC